MPLPLVPILAAAGIAGLGISGVSNLYGQHVQRRLYRRQEKAYRSLNDGYSRYLAKEGKSINPNRSWTSYYGQAEKARANFDTSQSASVGTLGGTIGAASIGLKTSGLYKGIGKTSRRL